jgi:hypothetical protein
VKLFEEVQFIGPLGDEFRSPRRSIACFRGAPY